MKKFIALTLVIFTILLSGCGACDKMKEGIKKADEHFNNFCSHLTYEEYDLAKEYLHKDTIIDVGRLKTVINDIENVYGIDFADGVVLERRTSFNVTLYDSKYNGSVYDLTYKAKVGTKSVTINYVIIDNDAGYGIYSFNVED